MRIPGRFGRWKRRRLIFYLCLAPLLVFILLTVFLNLYGRIDQARPAQAIVVLGAGVLKSGQPGASLRARTLHAVALYKQGLAPKIICTGGLGKYPPAEAAVASRLAQAQGVPVTDILLEATSKSTQENAENAARICRAHGWNRIIAVSDPYHLWRVRQEFAHVGLTAYPSPALAGASRRDPRFSMSVRETWLVVEKMLHL